SGQATVTLVPAPPPPGKVNTPTITPNGGSFTGSVQVTLQDTTSGASIYYTLNGTTPSGASFLYRGAITLSTNTTVNAMGIKTGMTNSDMATAVFTITPELTTVATPTFNPNGGTFVGSVSITLHTDTTGASIRY